MVKKNLIIIMSILVLYPGCAKRGIVKDDAGKIIPEEEINRNKGCTNFWLYTIGGGALSFGVSFFIGSLIERSTKERALLTGVTAGGTIIGTTIFALKGREEDRQEAIEKIKRQRRLEAERLLKQEEERQRRIKAEIERLKREKEEKEREKRRLLEKLKKKK